MGTTILGSIVLFHLATERMMPETSISTPLLANYVDAVMILVALSLLESVLALAAIRQTSYHLPSPFLWFLIVERIGRFFPMGQAGKHWRQSYLSTLNKTKAFASCEMKQNMKKRRRKIEIKKLLIENGCSRKLMTRMMDRILKRCKFPQGMTMTGSFLLSRQQGKLPKIRRPLEQIADDVTTLGFVLQRHLLKLECKGAWITLITVLDKIALVILLLLYGGVALFLFVLYPKTWYEVNGNVY